MGDKTLHRNIFQRIFGICATKLPSNEDCWTFDNGKIVVDLAHAPELAEKNKAIRLEKKNLPGRVLVVKGNDGEYHAFKNYCTHGKRRLDPVPETQQVQCCSVGKSVFDYNGKLISGSAKEDIVIYNVAVDDSKLVITI
ncbi:MAG: Rieske 2Fe-2S domain-containing protein [Ignavibacteria bacterium]|nr:Rieske 2Fe-2S domain-containing protein [Ignavibacteria bacterium]